MKPPFTHRPVSRGARSPDPIAVRGLLDLYLSPWRVAASRALVHGHAGERARIEGLLADARSGRSGVLVISGAVGSGRTALLGHAVERAEGFDVLQTTGIEAESQISFSGLDELLSPVAGFVDEIPEPQREALRAARSSVPSSACSPQPPSPARSSASWTTLTWSIRLRHPRLPSPREG